MRNFTNQITIFNINAVPKAAFTAAVTNIITSNAHGLSEGDCIQVATSTTLPAGLSASTNYYVISPTTNTFKVSTTRGGSEVDITDTGTGTHTYTLIGRKISVMDYRHLNVDFVSSGSANLTVKFQTSNQDDVDFGKAQSATNAWDYVDIKDLEDESSVDGDTGIALSGTDDYRHFEINLNGQRWLSANITAHSAGKLGVKVTGFNE